MRRLLAVSFWLFNSSWWTLKSDIDEFNEKKKIFENLKRLNECIDQANEKNAEGAEAIQANW